MHDKKSVVHERHEENGAHGNKEAINNAGAVAEERKLFRRFDCCRLDLPGFQNLEGLLIGLFPA
jgi:hypothetical protein